MGVFFICFKLKNNYQKSDLYKLYQWLIAGYLMIFMEKVSVLS